MGIAESMLIGSVGSALLGSRSAKKAAKAQTNAAEAANAIEAQQYEQSRKDLEPWRKQGVTSLSQLAALMRPGTDMTTRFSASDFKTDPGYQFRLQQGNRALDRSQAARGMLNSGAALKAAMKYGQGLASDEYQNAYNRWAQQNSDIYNRLAGLAGTGQQATNQLASLGSNFASQYGANVGQAANARASGYAAQAKSGQNLLSDVFGMYGSGMFGVGKSIGNMGLKEKL